MDQRTLERKLCLFKTQLPFCSLELSDNLSPLRKTVTSGFFLFFRLVFSSCLLFLSFVQPFVHIFHVMIWSSFIPLFPFCLFSNLPFLPLDMLTHSFYSFFTIFSLDSVFCQLIFNSTQLLSGSLRFRFALFFLLPFKETATALSTYRLVILFVCFL